MNQRRTRRAPRVITAVALGGALAGGNLLLTALPADAATTANLAAGGTLTVTGDNLDNAIDISRTAGGGIRVNGGAVPVAGGQPTVANVQLIQVFGLGGTDTIRLIETNGALPPTNLFGGTGSDALTAGSGADQLFGQDGNDTLSGQGGADFLFGGADDDVLTGGDADDQTFGEGGADRLVWGPGDDTDLNEGGAGVDTIEVNGGSGAEQFAVASNGARIRFDRVTPAPFSLDIGTSEKMVVNANGGDDVVHAASLAATPIELTVDGGAGNDDIRGTDGVDILLGGGGNDVVDGQRGDDIGFLGAGDDEFSWDPGDGSDTVEGQDGTDRLAFRGSNANEHVEVTANGGRVRFFRDVASVLMDLNDLEDVRFQAFGGADDIEVGDLSGTDADDVVADLAAAASAAPDGVADVVRVAGTQGEDIVDVTGTPAMLEVSGLAATVTVTRMDTATDQVVIASAAADDVVVASTLPVGAGITVEAGAGDDIAIGGAGDDTLRGEGGDDVLLGGPGHDLLDGGTGDDVLIDGEDLIDGRVGNQRWLATHARTVDGDTVFDLGHKQLVAPGLRLDSLR